MEILIITAMDRKGIALAEELSMHHEVTVLHPEKIGFECSFAETTVNEKDISGFPFERFQSVVYASSRKLPCEYLVGTLKALETVSGPACICLAEEGLDLSPKQRALPEPYICAGFRSDLGNRISVWYTAPVYGEDFLPDELMTQLMGRARTNKIVLPGREEQAFDMLHISDLTGALEAYWENGQTEDTVFLGSGQQSMMRELGKAIHALLPQTEIGYEDRQGSSSFPNDNPRVTGWMPVHSFYDDLPEAVRKIELEGDGLRQEKRGRRMKEAARLILFLLAFAVVYVYTSFIKMGSELQFVDLRLLFIVSSCLFWGRRYGLAAAVLCSASGILQSILGGTRWHVIFFHIDNWIPVAVYIASAVLFGMYHDNHTKDGEEG